MSASLHAFEQSLKSIEEIPYVTGKIPFNESNSMLFYSVGQGAKRVDFMSPTESQLQNLVASCQPTTFGVAQEDDFHRDAGEMNAGKFALPLMPQELGALEAVRSLFHGKHQEKTVRFELDKLNVYGPGTFSKAHVDTPRSDKLFGSLVLVLPTQHEGGALVFRHRGSESTFDTAKSVSAAAGSPPNAVFAVFWSDVEHEVLPVTSGYRVTVTYNLYLDDVDGLSMRESGISIPHAVNGVKEVVDRLSALLDDKTFLPEGGFIGFGLDHPYSFDRNKTRLPDIVKHLKGSDALLFKACKILKLDVCLQACYASHNEGRLFDEFPFADTPTENSLLSHFIMNGEGQGIYYAEPDGSRKKGYHEDDDEGELLPIVWVKPLGSLNSFSTAYIALAYGAELWYTEADICLTIRREAD